MKIGYARVSTGDQNLDLQMDALNKIECDKIFTDKMSGARSDRRIRPAIGGKFLAFRKLSNKYIFNMDNRHKTTNLLG